MAAKLIRPRRESQSGREILDVLFPAVRAAMLRALFASPPKERYVRELVRITGFALGTVQDELRMLSAVGLVTSWSNRYRRFYRANGENPLSSRLFRIVELSGRLPRSKNFRRAPQTSFQPVATEGTRASARAGAELAFVFD